jgi:hypothetical protein
MRGERFQRTDLAGGLRRELAMGVEPSVDLARAVPSMYINQRYLFLYFPEDEEGEDELEFLNRLHCVDPRITRYKTIMVGVPTSYKTCSSYSKWPSINETHFFINQSFPSIQHKISRYYGYEISSLPRINSLMFALKDSGSVTTVLPNAFQKGM